MAWLNISSNWVNSLFWVVLILVDVNVGVGWCRVCVRAWVANIAAYADDIFVIVDF